MMFLIAASSLALYGQVINLDQHWKFHRIDKSAEPKAKIENQGTDWSSQYNVTVVSQNPDLTVPKDTLEVEFAMLSSADQWQSVTLPHTAFVEEFTVLHQWQGICYYKRELRFEPEWSSKKLFMEFGAAMHLADVWVNGEHITQHIGGYLPFVVDLTGKLRTGQSNEILVRLDNRDNPLIPPGKPVNKLDFNYFSGLHRSVNLIVKPEVYISHPILANEVAGGGIFVTYPQVASEQAVVNVKTHVVNDSKSAKNITVVQNLYKVDGLFGKGVKGKLVASSKSEINLPGGNKQHNSQQINVEKPALWSPDEPNLYILESALIQDGKHVEHVSTRIGIRHLEMTRERGFVINGKPLRMIGSNRHSDYPYLGNAIGANAGYRDIWQIKKSGFNTVRLGHYPQDPAVLAACDELGVLAIEPIPGWQFFNKSPQFTQRTYQDIRDMFRRDRNHPSIVMWETTLNESWPPNEWKDGAVHTAHQEYPTDQCFTSGDAYKYYGFDVSYNDWEEGFNRPNISPNPGFIREYYDYEFGGHNSSTRIGRRSGEKALLCNAWNAQWSHNRYRAYYPQTMGDAVWSMYDYNRGCADNVCESGMADLFRLEKFSLPFFTSQISIGAPMPTGMMKPYLFIANYWTERKDDKVVVFSNVDQVELLVNDKVVARQRADSGMDSKYSADQSGWYTGGNPFDGGNCQNLTHPPFTFNNVAWAKGTIEAVGYIGGKKVVIEKIKTPEIPVRLEISYFESGRAMSQNDVVIIYVKVLDKNGTLCVDSELDITLAVSTGGELVSPLKMKSEAGIASFIVKTLPDASQLKVEAKSNIANTTKNYQIK